MGLGVTPPGVQRQMVHPKRPFQPRAGQIRLVNPQFPRHLLQRLPGTDEIHFLRARRTNLEDDVGRHPHGRGVGRDVGARSAIDVVAEIRGAEKPDEWVVVGGHLDSWDVGSGAQDNGSGCAMVLESARAIAALGHAPRRSMRFLLWAGEEEGFLGSRAYTLAHKAELPKCIAALNADAGAGHPKGWATVGRTDVADAFRPVAKLLLTDLGGAEVSDSTQFVLQSDHAFFLLNGIPTLELMPDLSKYFDVHHRSADTIEKILAVAAFAVADREEPIAPHATREQVMAILERTKTDTFVKEMGWLE